MATRKGLEPSTSGVTGRRSNQLNYRAIWGNLFNQLPLLFLWQGQKDSNPRHSVLETDALPAELYPYVRCVYVIGLVQIFIWWALRSWTFKRKCPPSCTRSDLSDTHGRKNDSPNHFSSAFQVPEGTMKGFGGPSGTRTPDRPVMSRML